MVLQLGYGFERPALDGTEMSGAVNCYMSYSYFRKHIRVGIYGMYKLQYMHDAL